MTSCNFQLDINRLKVLGINELEELDKRIEELKIQENSIINDSTLIEISQMILEKTRSISDLSCILDSYNTGVDTKKNQLQTKENEEANIKKQIEEKLKEIETIDGKINELENSLNEHNKIKTETIEKIKNKEEEIRLTHEMIRVKKENNLELETKYHKLETEHKKMYQIYLDNIKQINSKLLNFKTNYLFNFNQINTEILDLNTSIHFDLNDMNTIYTSKLRDDFMNIWCKNSIKFYKFYDSIKFIKDGRNCNYSYKTFNNITSKNNQNFINIIKKYLNNKIKRETDIFDEDIPELKEFVNFMENEFSLHLILPSSPYCSNSNFETIYGIKPFIKYFNDNLSKYYSENNCNKLSNTLDKKYTDTFFDPNFNNIKSLLFMNGKSHDQNLIQRCDISKYNPDEYGNIKYDQYGNIGTGTYSQNCRTIDDFLKPVYDRIKREYKKLLYTDIYTNDLKHLVDKLNFEELHSLFSPDFCVNDLKPDIFILFINFMGTGGKFIDYMGNEYKFI